MARFPYKQAEIMVLAEKTLNGLRDNQDIYPAPQVALADFEATIKSFHQAADKLQKAKAAKVAATERAQQALEALKENLRSQLRYAEITVGFDDDKKLKLLGWGGKKEPTALTAPGQPRAMKAVRQPDGSLELNWKPPADGGPVVAYEIMRSVNAEPVAADAGDKAVEWVGDWEGVEAACVPRASLTDQPQGVRLLYRVIGINKAGEGAASDAVLAVL